jgi:uncharacterized protein (TIGR03067 family)
MARTCLVLQTWATLLLIAPVLMAEEKPTDLDRLQGEWRRVQFEIDGKAGEAEPNPGLRIAADKISLQQNGKDLELVLTLKLDPTTDPKLLDLTLPDGQTLEGIYKLEENRWTVCIHGEPNIKNRPNTFESKPGSKAILAVFEKVQ